MGQRHQVHRDIKPSNICLNTSGEVKLTDFGIVSQLESTLQVCDTFVGTSAYMSVCVYTLDFLVNILVAPNMTREFGAVSGTSYAVPSLSAFWVTHILSHPISGVSVLYY
jgi:hypothetical protein